MQIKSSTRQIIATLLSLAMVLTLVVGLTVPAQADTTTFTRNLTVGSRGDDVVALQTTLEAQGYLVIPAGVAKGYFGSLTKAAVAKYQVAMGISPAAGYFGPITRAKISGSTVVINPGTCPVGMVCTPIGGGTGTLDNTDGSLSAQTSTAVSSSVTIKKGETKDLIAEQFTATAGKVAISRFDVKFSERPWLTFSKFEVVDNTTGAVLATKAVTGASDFTEVTVGSEYLLRFEGLNFIVTPGQNQTLKVRGTLLATSDKISNQVVTVTLPTNGVRTINGKGFTESIGTGATASVTLSSTGSTGNIVGRINSASPAKGTVLTSTSGQTNDVTLGIFDLKSENQAATVNALNFKIMTSGVSTSTLLKGVRLVVGGQTINASSIVSSTGSTTFTNLNIAIPQDQWVTVTLKGDIADQDDFTAGAAASSTIALNTTNVVGVDANYNTLTTTAATLVSNDLVFTNAAATISGMSASQTLVDNGTSASTKSLTSFTFTLNNTSSNNLYVSKTAALAVASSTNGASATTTGSATVTVTASTNPADTTTFYAIPAGSSRTFNYQILVTNTGNTAANVKTSITAIYYSDDTTTAQKYNINYGIEALAVSGQVF